MNRWLVHGLDDILFISNEFLIIYLILLIRGFCEKVLIFWLKIIVFMIFSVNECFYGIN